MSQSLENRKVNVRTLQRKKGQRKITMLTAYDYPTARVVDQAGIDLILVGDSVGTVVYGYSDTIPVTVEDMIRHGQAVVRGADRAMVVVDLPFLSYQVSIERAIENAGRIMKETGAHAVKLEGGSDMEFTISALTRIGIPVCGHIGLTPQSVHADGGYRTHGKSEREKELLLESAEAIERAGAFALVLECVTPEVAEEISKRLTIPTIGIGSGEACDGQVLVTHDLVGLTPGRTPKFVHPTADLKSAMHIAVERFIRRTQEPVTEITGEPPPAPKAAKEVSTPTRPGLPANWGSSNEIRLELNKEPQP